MDVLLSEIKVWSTKVGKGISQVPSLTGDPNPIVVGDIVVCGRFGERAVVGLRKSDGRMLWRAKFSNYLGESLLSDGDSIFGELTKEVFCLDRKSGKVVWKFKVEGESDDSETIYSKPYLHGNFLYFGDVFGNAYKLDKKNGDLAWKKKLVRTGKINASPFVQKGKIYFLSTRGNIVVVSLDGKILKRLRVGDSLVRRPILHKDRFYIAGSNGIYIFSQKMGSIKRIRIKGLRDAVVFENRICALSDSGEISVFDTKSMALVLKREMTNYPCSLSRMNRTLMVTGFSALQFLNLKDLGVRHSIAGLLDAIPDVVGHHLYLNTEKGIFCASMRKLSSK